MLSLETLIGRLAADGVEMIVVGALAAVAQGAAISTHDLDIVHRRTDANLQRLVTSLLALDARDRGRDDILRPTVEILRGTGHSLLQTSWGPIDVLGAIEGERDYDALLPDTIELTIAGHSIRLLSLAKIVEIKRTSTRFKDRQMLPVLEETLRRR